MTREERQKAIYVLEHSAPVFPLKKSEEYNDYVQSINQVIDWLEHEPKWIPTSERYPRPDDEYKLFLVTDDKGKVSVQEFYLSLDEEPQPYFSGMAKVIAWMPLPNAYKEVDV